MIEIITTYEQRERAKRLYSFHNLNHSIMHGESDIYGAMGEIAVHDWFSNNLELYVEHKSTYDYDIIVDGFRFEVKSKVTTVTPLPHYLCAITHNNTTQDCDFYIFTRVLKGLQKVFILGYIEKSLFYEVAFKKFAGEIDDEYSGFTFKRTCFNIKIEDLKTKFLHY